MYETLLIPDAHAHVGSREELLLRARLRVPTILNIETAQEAKLAEPFIREGLFTPSYGIHPWRADIQEDQELAELAKGYRIRGEIGMDSVWCDVPLSVQRTVLLSQLELAKKQGQPVVLHTKGQEEAVAECIARYENRYLVHWFSAACGLEAYRKLDCYFSVGPDVWWNDAVRQVALLAPIDRILIETDGMGAVRWAYEESGRTDREEAPRSVPESLERTLRETALLRGMEAEALAECVRVNYHHFTSNC